MSSHYSLDFCHQHISQYFSIVYQLGLDLSPTYILPNEGVDFSVVLFVGR